MFKYKVINRATCCKSFLSNLRAILISDVWIECCNDTDRVFTISRQRSLFTVIPSIHFSRSVSIAFGNQVRSSIRHSVMIGSITFSCNCPASAAIITVVSLPITLKQVWFVTSGITGFTLPGIILEPGAIGGRLISFRPQRGPEANRRRSLQILESLTG